MDELIRQLHTIAHGMWRYRWPAVALAWLIAAAGAVVVWKIPNQYEASARIYVDTQSILKPLMAGLTIQPNVEQQIGMLSRTLLSRPNLEKLVRMADVDLRAEGKAEQEAIIDRLAKDIQMRNTGRDNLYTLVYRDQDPEKAKRVIQSLVSMFVESSLGSTRKDSDQAKTFLNEQIKQHEAKLEEAEARMRDFRIRNLEMQSPDGKDAPARLAEINQQLQGAMAQLKEAENGRDAAKAQIAALEKGQLPGMAPPTPAAAETIQVSTPEIDARLDVARRNIDALAQRYTDQHPDVVQARRLLRELEEQKKREVAELRKQAAAAAAGSPVTAAPGSVNAMVAQELQRMLAAAEIQVSAMRARVAELNQRMAQARVALRDSPQREAEAAQMNRDYGIIKQNYQTLVARRQSAVMSSELEVAAGVADFRLIDPPRVTPQPVAPNRMLLMPVPLLLGVGAALALAFLLSQLRPTFIDSTDLRQKTGLPVLGVVTAVLTDADVRRHRNGVLRFAGATGALFGVFMVAVVATALLQR